MKEPTLTRQKLASELGITPAVYSQWVSGVTRIPDRHLMYISRRLGFNPLDFRPELSVTYGSDLELAYKLSKLDANKHALVILFIDWLLAMKL